MAVEIIRKRMGLAEMAEVERARAQAEKNEGLIAYVAMMADVDLPEDETSKEETPNV